ncbi:MAG: hypothetical protein R3E02_09980 [Blastomonas sp.]
MRPRYVENRRFGPTLESRTMPVLGADARRARPSRPAAWQLASALIIGLVLGALIF